MPSSFFIVGPTAVGKTCLAVAVAERCGAEIVNADAFQLYAGLDLLTAKPSPEQLHRARHHLVGTVPLTDVFNVARYQQGARQCLDEIALRQRPALVVGGSGLYVKSLTHGLSPLPPAQPELRAELDTLDLETLRQRLATLDPACAAVIDTRNKRRLVRAVEVCITTGQPFSAFREEWSKSPARTSPIGVLLVRGKAGLNARIKHRVETMFQRGVVEEVRAVAPVSVARTAAGTIGWREIQAHLRGECDLKTCMERIEFATRRYAKRQLTWFRKETIFEELALADGDECSPRDVDFLCRRVRRASA